MDPEQTYPATVPSCLSLDEAQDMVAGFVEAFHNQDVQALADGWTDDVVIRFADLPEIRGKRDAMEWVTSRFARQRGYRLVKTFQAVTGDAWALQTRTSWTARWALWPNPRQAPAAYSPWPSASLAGVWQPPRRPIFGSSARAVQLITRLGLTLLGNDADRLDEVACVEVGRRFVLVLTLRVVRQTRVFTGSKGFSRSASSPQ